MWNARLRLGSLWLSQVARVMADNGLRIMVVLLLAREASTESAWHLVTVVLLLPAIFFVPVSGALINSLSKRLVLIGSAGFCLLASFLFFVWQETFLVWWVLLAMGTSIFGPACHALYPAAAGDARVPLTRINGWMEMGAMLAIGGGFVLGSDRLGFHMNPEGLIVAGLSVVAFLAALPVCFPSDVRRPEPPAAALAGFSRDCGQILDQPEARGCLVGLACLRGGVTGLMVALLGVPRGKFELSEMFSGVLVGLALGSFLASRHWHPRRVLGLVPIGAAGLTLFLAGFTLSLAGLRLVPSSVFCALLGIMGGLVNVPLSATYQAAVPADARGNAMAIRYLTDYLGVFIVTGLLFSLATAQVVDVTGQLWLLTAIALVATILCSRWLFRELLELVIEFILWPMYRIRAHGPGVDELPLQGPLIVLGNHSAWFDPMWVAKVIPRRLIPMMTSVFFDLPVIRWLMVHVAHTIRVQAARFRREVPELKEAVAALDRGECLLVFPEGGMRRKADQPLRLFGQGIWHILRERPNTPIVVCWIEGGWGSYFSHCNGPPGKNKPLDFFRRIDIAICPPQVLGPTVLESHRTTRNYLMQACLEARRHLGLEPFALQGYADISDNDEKDEPDQKP